jgi:RecQ family ATP-dependent DNA helicase
MSEAEMKKVGEFSRVSVLRRLIEGKIKVLFTTPEQAFSNSCMPYMKEMMAQNRISRIVVDEAHLLRQWESFRSQFQNFGNLRSCFPGVPMILMTACLPRATRSHLSSQIGFKNVMINRCPANRRNSFYMVQRKISDEFDGTSSLKDEYRKIRGPTLDRLVALLRGPFCGASAIIYCRTARLTGILSNYLRETICDTAARHFHAQLSQEERVENQKYWMESAVPIMVATCAFGLGINHPHVRLIVHWDMPQTLDDYFQQAGRAGRDGAPCLILSFYHPNDLDGTLSLGVSDPNRSVEVACYLENQIFCRRSLILSEYAEPCPPSMCQTSCDVCYYKKSWSLYDISRFANNLLALVLYLPQHIEPLDVKRHPFRWLVSLLRGDIKAIKTLLTNPHSSSLCKTGIIPGFGSMRNLCKDDAFTIVLSLFEHGVFNIIKQESKQYGKGQQSHTWKIVSGDDILSKEMSSCKSDKYSRLIKPRYVHPIFIPLPALTIQRLQNPVGGTWDDNPDHAMFCGWCKQRCFIPSPDGKSSYDSYEVRQFPCAPILAHKECIDDEHDDEENRAKYDDPENCMLCRNLDCVDRHKKVKKNELGNQLIICHSCNKGTCSSCLTTFYELDDDAIRILTSLESAKWFCAHCDPFTVPLCYQWHRAERMLESRGQKDATFRKRDEPMDLLSALLEQTSTQCERALQFCDHNLAFMENDLMPLESSIDGKFPLFSFVTSNDVSDAVQRYYMVLSHSSAGAFVYAVEFHVNPRSNALQPPKPNIHDLFDEKFLLRMDCSKIKQINVETKQFFHIDGTSNVWCPLNTINKIRRELLSKVKLKQRYRWTRLEILAAPNSEDAVNSKSKLGKSDISLITSSPSVQERSQKISLGNEQKTSARITNSRKDDILTKTSSSLLIKRGAVIQESIATKLQKVVEPPSHTTNKQKIHGKLQGALYRASNDSSFHFSRKDLRDAKLSFELLMVSMMSHKQSILPIDDVAIRIAQTCLASSEYGDLSIYHVIFIAMYRASLPIRSSDIALIIQSMGFCMLNQNSVLLSHVIQNTLHNHHLDFSGGIFQCKKQYWFLNPATFNQRSVMKDICRTKDSGSANMSNIEGSHICTVAASFGRRLKICPNTFLRLKPAEARMDDRYCMVTTEKRSNQWQRCSIDHEGNSSTEILVRWFVEPKKDRKISYGARELYAFEGGTGVAWSWVNADAILEVVFVKWGLLEPEETNSFEFFYNKNVNTFAVSSGPGQKTKTEICISQCNPVRFEEEFWEHDLLEFRNPDPYQSKLYVDPLSADLYNKSALPSIQIGISEKSKHSTIDLVQDRTHFNLACSRNLMSRHYAHPPSIKLNIRNCHVFEFADLIETAIFRLLQSQLPMPFQTLCDEIGVRSEFRADLNAFCKNALSPDIFLIDTFSDAYGYRSKFEYISLNLWEVAFENFQNFENQTNLTDKIKLSRDGITWKRAFETVSGLCPNASILYKCAAIANAYPTLCERHLKSKILQSSAAAAYFLHEIDVHVNNGSLFHQDIDSAVDPEIFKILKSSVLVREIVNDLEMKTRVSAAPESVDRILILSDDEPSSKVIDAEIDDDDDSDDDRQFSEILLRQKRPLERLNLQDNRLFTPNKGVHQKLGPDDSIIFQFALLFCLKSLQSNLTFELSSVRDKILHLHSPCSNATILVERAALTLHERGILVYNSTSSEKACDPSPCFHLNVEKGLVTLSSSSATTQLRVNRSNISDSNVVCSSKTNVRAKQCHSFKFRSEFSFVAPPKCQSFQDQQVFLRFHSELSDLSTAVGSHFTSMYSHFRDLEAAISFLRDMDEDEKNHACPDQAHPVIKLIEGDFKDFALQEKDDDYDIEFEEPVSFHDDKDIHPEAFKPFCQRPDPNVPDYRKKIDVFLKLDFEVAYSIEHYISSGGLMWNALDHQDLEKLEQYSNELIEARKSSVKDKYAQILNKIKVQLCNKVNMERMKIQSALDNIEEMNLPKNKKNIDRKKVASEDIQAMERCTVFAGVFQEHRGVKLKPSVYGKFSCRAYRKFGSHRFITVTVPRSATPAGVRCLLNHGFKTIVGDRLYQFIPSGDSHLKERKLMFFAVSGQNLDPFLPQNFLQWHIPLSRDMHSAYFSNSDIISIKFFARFQLCFSASAIAMNLSTDEYEFIDDVDLDVPGISKRVCATDGCGRAPPIFFVKIKETFKLAYVPSCVQIRFGGCKGLLHVDPRVSKVQFRRKSQRKYIFDDALVEQRQIEVTSWSPSHQASTADMTAKLNLQLAFVLRSMGVPDDFFYSLLKQTRELVLGAIGKGSSDQLHREAALEFVQKFKGMPHCEEIRSLLQDNVLDVTHPYVVRSLKHAIDLILNPIQSAFHMPVPEMKFLYGVPDPTGILEYGQCFVFLGEAADGAVHRRFEDTEVVVGRNPMQHPGDVRKLTAVFVPELYNMKLCNVLVFPVKGNPATGQLLNDEMSGGDFDGDQYIFIWNKEVTKCAKHHDPYPYYLDGKELSQKTPFTETLSTCVDSCDLDQSANLGQVVFSALERKMGSESSQQLIDDGDRYRPSDGPIITFDSHSILSAGIANSFLSSPFQGPSSSRNNCATLSDPASWTSDDVKGIFNTKIGFSCEEAYEKMKLCALGVICHWDNNLGNNFQQIFEFFLYESIAHMFIEFFVAGRLCNLQRDIADFSLHEAKMRGSDNHRTNGFADPDCMEIAPLVARAVDSLKTGEIVRVPKKFSKTAEHWLKSKSKLKEGSTYNSGSLFGVIAKDIVDLQHLVLQFVQSSSHEVVNSQLIDSMCRTQHRGEVSQLVQKVRKRVDEEWQVIYEIASHLDTGARSQHVTEGINRMCKEQEEFVKQYLTDKGYGANLSEYMKMYLFRPCQAFVFTIQILFLQVRRVALPNLLRRYA